LSNVSVSASEGDSGMETRRSGVACFVSGNPCKSGYLSVRWPWAAPARKRGASSTQQQL